MKWQANELNKIRISKVTMGPGLNTLSPITVTEMDNQTLKQETQIREVEQSAAFQSNLEF